MTLWTSADASAATGGRSTAAWRATGISIDTRTLQPGDLFVALKAARDGHDFVAAALEKGAAAALVSHVPDDVPEDAPLLIVPDVLLALEQLGQAARARTGARVVAITGSVGKTSTKEMLRAALAGQGRTHASVASYNNHWGVPLTLARMPADTEFAVIEIGMNHPGEIAPLAKQTRPHVVLVTTVAAAHLEAFDNIEGIAAEKASIMEGLEPGGTAVLNADIDTANVLAVKAAETGAQPIWFGETGTDYRLEEVRLSGNTTVARASHEGGPILLRIQSAGRHFAMNALGALAAARALGADPGIAASDIGRWTPVTGRGAREIVWLDPAEPALRLELIDDSYNANPTSMAAALEVLAAAQPVDGVGRVGQGRRIAYLGDMKELGPDELALHRAIAQLDTIGRIDVIHCVGPRMRALHEVLPDVRRGRWTETAEAMAEGLRRDIDAGDVVLAKGSLSTGLGRVVDALRKLGHPAPAGARAEIAPGSEIEDD